MRKLIGLLLLCFSLAAILDLADSKGMGKNARVSGMRKNKQRGRGGGRNSYGGVGPMGGFGREGVAPEDMPCIGLCYHNKLMALEAVGGEVEDDEDLDYSRGWPLNAAKFEKPCVGLCYYFRELGIPNPHAKVVPPPDGSAAAAAASAAK